MAVCANCQHGVKDHDADGCKYGRAFKDQGGRCTCLFDYHDNGTFNSKNLPVRESQPLHQWAGVPLSDDCRTCGHTLNWHHSEDEIAKCSCCHVCDGFVHGQASWTDECGAGHENAPDWTCRRKRGDHDVHAEGTNRWLERYATPPKEKNVGTANPDRISYKDAVNFADVPKVADTQVGGEHYRQTGIQPWDIIDAWGLDFYAGNALKYLYRAGRKGPKVEDLKKARHYIDKMIEKEES